MYWTKSAVIAAAILAFTATAPSTSIAAAQSTSTTIAQAIKDQPTGPEWWRHAVIYELYPRSFQDSNNDGVGDLKGITSRLDYLHDLGIDAIWITPMYPSPGIDYGYDISNYVAIDPLYGSMQDFDNLVAEAKKRDIRIIMDYVINHTSDKHEWFIESRSSRDNPKRNWYVWHDGKGQTATDKGQPPNNWQSWFGHSAWQWDEKTRQYYYHYFYVEQPDLNWRNPEVHKAMDGVLDFWMQRGVAGFRIDAVSRLFEDPQMRDDPYLPGHNAYGDRNIQHKYTDDLPQVHDVLKEVRKVVDKYPGNPVLVTEADEPNVQALTKMYGNADEVQLPMDFQIADVNELSAPRFRELFHQIENNSAHGQPEFFFSNHDQRRQWDRYGDGEHNDQIAKLMAVLELTARGTPQMYYGEELGMRTTDPARVEDVHDPIGKLGWPKEKGRDGERTPMQWDATPQAGFTTVQKPWLPIPPTSTKYNVETESKDPDSIYNAYKRLLSLRKTEPALRDGAQIGINNDDKDVFAFVRTTGDASIVVALNMSGKPQKIALDWKSIGVTGTKLAPLYSSPKFSTDSGDRLELPPFAALVAKIE
ncbi:alpha-glucosidase [Occallatibacter savannae]|uniref:alpha-glucosidase n=1 Tax=Occallatibacter savannae TaxID=1002691 RepID=UPI000D6885CA|nr:alpha-glucosidase [Occallatibacter savannae]